MGCLIMICLIAAIIIIIASLVIMGVWNCILAYLAWSMFNYTLPNMSLWQAVCAYFAIVFICAIFKISVTNNNDD